ncbi:DUF3024 domain-containing protein [Candidatus Formimonas warabiya]|uniref:Uncharacterized protein n=1 Tax=Formimonas warabiya TaxID=1761012 RepID=A0A3G1KU26_FORW1|nr:DUF3024 domain-containing protein [Candidatus Formimonas warabiya]ATW26013.1 hypothetical protein DCMF_15620 [Candidatus Formimonas warabiya]
MSPHEIERIVKATIEAMDIYGGDRGFMESVKRFNLGEEKLELWISAYEAGGISGIRALTELFTPDKETMKEALNQINDFFITAWPALQYRVVRRQNRITVSIKNKGQSGFYDLCQLRYTPFDGMWHLYWKRSNGKWCPYVSDIENIGGLLWKTLYLLKLDEFGCFFG